MERYYYLTLVPQVVKLLRQQSGAHTAPNLIVDHLDTKLNLLIVNGRMVESDKQGKHNEE